MGLRGDVAGLSEKSASRFLNRLEELDASYNCCIKFRLPIEDKETLLRHRKYIRMWFSNQQVSGCWYAYPTKLGVDMLFFVDNPRLSTYKIDDYIFRSEMQAFVYSHVFDLGYTPFDYFRDNHHLIRDHLDDGVVMGRRWGFFAPTIKA